MRVALALWSVAATLVPCTEAALRNRGARRTSHHHSELSAAAASAAVDAALRARAEKTKFGPGNCISTWRNEDGHCEIETHCKDQDISKYPVKFICIDNGGEKVRHVFAVGSFDEEEQFDTLIECKHCLGEKQEELEIISDVLPLGSPTKKVKHEKPEEEQDSGTNAVKELRAEVKSLEGFMMSTSEELQKLNKKVYSKGFQPNLQVPCVNCDVVGKKAGAKAKTPPGVSSLMHHKTFHQEQGSVVVQPQIVDPVRLKAQAIRVKEERRSQLAEDDEDVKGLAVATKKAEAVASSLAGALKGAEEQDDNVPARQPAKAQMMMPKAAETPTPQHRDTAAFSVSLPKSADNDDDDDEGDEGGTTDEESSSVPQSADEFERQAEEEDERPSFSALQQHGDEDGEDEQEVTDSSDDDEAQEDEDVSE